MAYKDHSLDKPIIDAAFVEFMKKGYDKASMRTIAANAEVTIGAIYTRYPTKNELFYSLVEPLIDSIKLAFSSLKADYSSSSDINSDSFLMAMLHESDTILHLLFDDYNRAKLLLCKAQGSKLENFFNEIVELKINETITFFKLNQIKIDNDVLRLLIKTEFNIYHQIIEEGYKLDKAKNIMDNIMLYHIGGWQNLLNHLDNKGE